MLYTRYIHEASVTAMVMDRILTVSDQIVGILKELGLSDMASPVYASPKWQIMAMIYPIWNITGVWIDEIRRP